MFGVLVNSFLDVFKKPLNILYSYIFLVLSSLGFSIIVEYTFDYLPGADISAMGQVLYIIKNYFWMFLLFLFIILLFFYLVSLFITYIINKKSGEKQRTLGVSKVFGFTLFLGLISMIPNMIFGLFDSSLTLTIIVFILSLIYIFIIYPYLFLVPVILVSKDLKQSISESFKFAKKHYGWIILLQILFIFLISILGQLFDFLATYLTEIGSTLLFLLIFSILFLWSINFIYNWYKSEN